MKPTVITTEFILTAIFLVGVIVIAIARPESLEEFKNMFYTAGGLIGAYNISRGIAKNGNGK